jgi:hypothetical protein
VWFLSKLFCCARKILGCFSEEARVVADENNGVAEKFNEKRV